jgi:hypothetical protein
MPEWRPIETAPDDGRVVLAWVRFPSGNGNWNILQRDIDGEWLDDNGDRLAPYEPTHWMPLPDPPPKPWMPWPGPTPKDAANV